MEKVMETMKKFQRVTKWMNFGTLLAAIALLVTAALYFLPQYLIAIAPTLYSEQFITIIYMVVYGVLIFLLFLYSRTVKDIQKGVKITLVRSLFSVILLIPLVFPLTILMGLVWCLVLIFFIISLLLFLLLLSVVRELQALQKKLST